MGQRVRRSTAGIATGLAGVLLLSACGSGRKPRRTRRPLPLPRYLVSTPMDGVWSLDRVWLCCPAIDGPGGVAARSRDTR